MSNNANVTAHYAEMFKGWDVKLLGAKPTAEQLANIHGLSARPGKQALACAMALRDKGVTAGQIVIACGAPQLNKMRGFIEDALLKRLPAPKTAQGHTVYKLELTAKGKAKVERTAKAEAAKVAQGEAKPDDKPAKAKGAAKPRKATKAEQALVDALVTAGDTAQGASVTVNVPEVPAADQPQA